MNTLTESEIDALQAGPELNAMICQFVFGHHLEKRPGRLIGTKPDGEQFFGNDYWFDLDDDVLYLHAIDGFKGMVINYSGSWCDMKDVVDKILEENWWSDFGGDFFLENWQDDEWVCCNRAPGERKERFMPVFYAVGKTAPLAVCRVALKAVWGLNPK